MHALTVVVYHCSSLRLVKVSIICNGVESSLSDLHEPLPLKAHVVSALNVPMLVITVCDAMSSEAKLQRTMMSDIAARH